MHEILSFQIIQYQHHEELNLLLNTAKQINYHCFLLQQQPIFSLSEKASQVSRTALLSHLIAFDEAQLTKWSILFLCYHLTNTYISLINDTLFIPLSDTIFEVLNGVWRKLQPSDITGVFRKSSFEFLKSLTSTIITAALQSRKGCVHKVARQEIEGFTYLMKTYVSSVKDADLSEEEIFDSLKLLSLYIHIFWKSIVRHIFSATKLVAKTYAQLYLLQKYHR